MSNLEYMCEGCKRADMNEYRCTAYSSPPSPWVKAQCCPHNRHVKTAKEKQRVGQQKGVWGKKKRR